MMGHKVKRRENLKNELKAIDYLNQTSGNRWFLFVLLIPYGILITKGNMIKKYILKFESQISHPALSLYDSWINTWCTLLIGGLLGAAFYWFIGFKYFRSRLQWCGVKDPNKDLVRIVSIKSSLIYSLPGLVILYYETFAFDNFIAAINYPGIGWELLILQLMWWSSHNQWVGVKKSFNLSGFKPFFWFYLFPMGIQFIYIHQKFYLRTIKDILLRFSL